MCSKDPPPRACTSRSRSGPAARGRRGDAGDGACLGPAPGRMGWAIWYCWYGASCVTCIHPMRLRLPRLFASGLAALSMATLSPARAAADYVYPLRVAASGRYLVDQAGTPWRVQADAAWLMSTNATAAE